MTNNEKALELVQKCLDDWPYAATRVVDIMKRLEQVKALLKEQEPVVPQKHYNEKADLLYACGKCHNDLKPNNRNAKFCWFCGKPVLWK